jgi:2-hydroxychromene-2-carboxylate isomerase
MGTREKQIELFYDVASAYSYLAITQLDAIERRTGAAIRLRPFLLGGVFKATGNGPPAQVAAKARWLVDDVARWGEIYAIPVRIPSGFPVSTLVTQRALVACERALGARALRTLTVALFRASWVDDRDVSSVDVVLEVAREEALEADAIGAAIGDPATKDALRATTDEAIARGAFGAPSFFVGDALYFGNDRIPMMEHFLRAGA